MTDRLALRSVVRFLGIATVLFGVLYLLLLGLVVAIAGKTGGSVDPVVAALIGGATALVTTPVTALGTLLLAPSLARRPDEPVPVTNAGGDPLAVVEQDGGTYDPVLVGLVAFLLALLLLLVGALALSFG